MSVTLNAKITRHPQVVEQLLPGEAVLLVPARGEVKVLNEVGARIWMLLDGTRTVGEIVSIICSEYAVDLTHAEHDTLVFIHNLLRRDLLVVAA